MGKLTNRRYYLDYNSTSPLAKSVVRWLSKGDFDFMNPSSRHLSGKKADQAVAEVKDFLTNLFGLDHSLFFHSGATEGSNTLIRGWREKMGDLACFFYSPLDHPSIKESAKSFGDRAFELDVDCNGDLILESSIQKIKGCQGFPVLINYTVVNNQFGNHWLLSDALQIKEATGCQVHVDASQLVGKVPQWYQLEPDLDCYTFSGHKFGALKGVGFSFVKQDFSFTPMLVGGSQQKALRAGTVNVAGIYSLMLALRGMGEANSDVRDFFEQELEKILGDKGQIVAKHARQRAHNTTCFVVFEAKSEALIAALDLAGLEVSSGSACSSGIDTRSDGLNYFGFDTERVMAKIRVSFTPSFTRSQASKVITRLKKVIISFIGQ